MLLAFLVATSVCYIVSSAGGSGPLFSAAQPDLSLLSGSVRPVLQGLIRMVGVPDLEFGAQCGESACDVLLDGFEVTAVEIGEARTRAVGARSAQLTFLDGELHFRMSAHTAGGARALGVVDFVSEGLSLRIDGRIGEHALEQSMFVVDRIEVDVEPPEVRMRGDEWGLADVISEQMRLGFTACLGAQLEGIIYAFM